MSAPVQSLQPIPETLRQHSPLPWHFDGDWYRIPTIFSADGKKVASVEKDLRESTPERAANAAFIVEACNSYATLKTRFEQAERAVDVLEAALKEARAAVASLPKFALGGASVEHTDGSGIAYEYPIRDELLARIDAALESKP